MAQKQVTMIPRNHKKVAQEVTLMKLIFLRKMLSQLTAGKFYLIKNLEEKLNDLYMSANSNKEMQIKGDKQLIDLTSSVEFLTSK